MAHDCTRAEDYPEINYYPSPAFRKPPLWCRPGEKRIDLVTPALDLLHEVYQALGGGQ
jgi:hypothetical protein